MVLRSPMLYELCLLLMEFSSSSSLRSGVEKLSALYPHSYQGQYFSFLVHGSWWCSPFHIRTKIHKSHRSARLSLVFQLRLSRQPAMNLIWILKWTFFMILIGSLESDAVCVSEQKVPPFKILILIPRFLARKWHFELFLLRFDVVMKINFFSFSLSSYASWQ